MLTEFQKKRKRLIYQRKWSKQNPDYAKSFRIKCLNAYGGNPPKCACCKENKYEFLCIDHIKGGGRKHRKKLGFGGQVLYRWLVKYNFPKGFQVLCHNCNLAKGFYGKCPHKNK